MSDNVISKQLNENGVTQYHVLGVNDIEFFGSLLSFLKQSYGAKLLNEDDGVFTKKAYLNIKGIPVTLEHHDDIGNFFYSEDKEALSLLEEIAVDLDSRLKNISYEE